MDDFSMFEAAGRTLLAVLQPERLGFLSIGVLVGLLIGLLPGIGGLTGFALLVPFTFTMDPISGLAMMLGMKAASSISDPITSVLFGVPGEAGSQATVLDGHAMAKKGEAGRALSAAYTASILGGLIGAILLAFTLQIVRPVVLAVGMPELFAMTVLGIAMVSALSGNAPLRGIVVACLGILIGMIGTDVMAGQQRWTFDIVYLWEGVPLLPVVLGLFALPELCDMAVQRGAMSSEKRAGASKGMVQGAVDCFRNWFLIIRCSSLGAVIGALPGISSSVLDWFAYGHALQTEKGAKATFSKGDVRGVIAPESATASANGAALVPLIAFGIPGGAATAILLGAMMVHGIVPGPDMLTKHIDVTYSMIWSIALANVLGGGLCFLLSGQLAKIATLRYSIILPLIMAIVYIGAFQGANSWGDMVVLFLFGLVGWVMRYLKWPRPPLILGLVLGVLVERYMSISFLRYGSSWFLRPIVVALLVVSVIVLMKPLYTEIRHNGIKRLLPKGRPSFRTADLAYAVVIGIAAYMLIAAQAWSFSARIGPTVVAATLIVAAAVSLLFLIFSRAPGAVATSSDHHGIHMDIEIEEVEGGQRTAFIRSALFFGWILAFFAAMALIGMIPAIILMIVAYMRIEGSEPWRLCLLNAVLATAVVYGVFDRILHLPWPGSLLGQLFPALAAIVPSM